MNHDIKGRARIVGGCVEQEDGRSGGVASVRTRGGTALRIRLPAELEWRVERLPYMPEFGRVVERAALVGRGTPQAAFELVIETT